MTDPDYLAGLKRELAGQTDPDRRKVIQAEIDRVSPPPERPKPRTAQQNR